MIRSGQRGGEYFHHQGQRPAPLGVAIGTMVPREPARGRWWASPGVQRQPSGMELSPFCTAFMILPLATLLRDISTTMGCPSGQWAQGQPKARGLVPKLGLFPPQGAMAEGVLEKARPIRLLRAMLSA